MQKTQVDEILKNILMDISKVKIYITDNTDIIENLGFDSIEVMELIVRIEEEFKIEFSDEDLSLSNFGKYKDLLNFIQSAIKKD